MITTATATTTAYSILIARMGRDISIVSGRAPIHQPSSEGLRLLIQVRRTIHTPLSIKHEYHTTKCSSTAPPIEQEYNQWKELD
mmetsp:Transcript_20313/g.56580  ORF Transcript_20313/g.56580 Transcript_20313/m.56580 type:complete len:84 (+) Transcript_20313:679-930(+)